MTRPALATSTPRKAARPRPGRAETETVFNALRALVHTLYGTSRHTEKRLGVTSAQLFVLVQLRDDPSLSINELAERTLTHQSTVSVVVRRLVARKLVRKIRSAEDGRRVELTLTTRGIALLRRAPEPIQARLTRAIDGLTPRDRRALAMGLSRLVGAIGTVGSHAPMFFEAMA